MSDHEELIAKAADAIQQRASWPSLHWPNLDALQHRSVAEAIARAALQAVTVPTENERALAILAAHGFHDPKSVLETVNEAIIEDLSFTTRESVYHALWSVGGWIKHKGCPNNPKHGNADAEYENGCKTCETYLLAVADALLAVRLPVPVDEGTLPGCTGDYECPAPAHQHGCMSDTLGHCNDPADHQGAVPVEPEWEYGFSADGGTVVERAFGIIPFKTAEDARHTGSKWFEETLDIVRRTKGVPAGEWQPVASDELEGTS